MTNEQIIKVLKNDTLKLPMGIIVVGIIVISSLTVIAFLMQQS